MPERSSPAPRRRTTRPRMPSREGGAAAPRSGTPRRRTAGPGASSPRAPGASDSPGGAVRAGARRTGRPMRRPARESSGIEPGTIKLGLYAGGAMLVVILGLFGVGGNDANTRCFNSIADFTELADNMSAMEMRSRIDRISTANVTDKDLLTYMKKSKESLDLLIRAENGDMSVIVRGMALEAEIESLTSTLNSRYGRRGFKRR